VRPVEHSELQYKPSASKLRISSARLGDDPGHSPLGFSGALILAVAIAALHVLMSTVAREQEIGVRRLAAVYLDGISTTIYPHVVARNLTNTTEALRRTMWFHQSMREQRALMRLPDGSLFADVSGPNGDAKAEDPFRNAGLRQ
jgi:hypothetical protein